MAVLVVEFGAHPAYLLVDGLSGLGWRVVRAGGSEAALRAMRRERYAALLLDVDDRVDGALGLLRSVWQLPRPLPTVVLTRRGGYEEQVRWLDAGADRCLVAPVSWLDLDARLRALIRSLRPAESQRLVVGDLRLDPALRTASVAGRPLVLSGREFELLQLLMRHAGRPLSRRRIEQLLYADGRAVDSNAVEVHVHHLRRRLGRRRLLTVPDAGYVLAAPPAGL